MTPDHLKKLNRLQSNVTEIEKVLAGLRDGGEKLWAEHHVSAEVSQAARKILADDLERQLAEAKTLFAAADAPPVAKPEHRDARCIKRLRDLADSIENDRTHLSTFSTSVGRETTGVELLVRWHESR